MRLALAPVSRELGVPVANDEPDASKPLPHRQVPSLLGDPRRVGVPGRTEDVDSPGPDLIAKSTYSVRSQTVSTKLLCQAAITPSREDVFATAVSSDRRRRKTSSESRRRRRRKASVLVLPAARRCWT